MSDSNVTHTPGPIVAPVCSDKRFGWGTDGGGVVFYIQCRYDSTSSPEAKKDIALMRDAYNSYDRHFGHNAVKAARADALGMALMLLKETQFEMRYDNEKPADSLVKCRFCGCSWNKWNKGCAANCQLRTLLSMLPDKETT